MHARLATLFRVEYARLVASVLRIVRDIDAAQEIVQEAFAQALVHWPEHGEPARPGAWLLTTARRRAIDAVRRGARRPQAPLVDLPPARHPVAPDSADLALERMSTQSAIALVSRLPRLQAEVILLRVVAGLDTESVAQLVGRTPGAVRVAAHRGLRTLAQILAAEGVTL